MKCSSRRNCNVVGTVVLLRMRAGLNEVQLPKELQQQVRFANASFFHGPQ